MSDAPSVTAFSPPPAIAGRASQTRSSSIEEPINVGSLSEAATVAAETAARIRLLWIEAYSEGIPFSETSLADFRGFQSENSPRKRPAIFLTYTGNIRAVWKRGEEQIGLQFLGNREVQFVIFSARPGSKSVSSRLAGNIGQDEVMSFARAAGIEQLFLS